MDNKLKKLKGFTIIELLVVVAIISVLASIGVPAAMTWIRDSKITKANSNAQLVYTAAQDYLTQQEIKNVSLNPGTGTSNYIYCAADSHYSLNIGGVPITSNLRGAVNTPLTPVDFTSALGDEFEGVWAVRFNSDTYTVNYAWWTEIPAGAANAQLYGESVLTTPYTTYAEQEAAYRSTGKIIGQFPIQ